MYSEIKEELIRQLPECEFAKLENKTWHLGIFTEPVLSYMMDGKKTIESRFSKNKIAPYNKIDKTDIIFIKKSGGSIIGYLTIKDIMFFDLNTISISSIKEQYEEYLCVDDSFWEQKKDSHYATLIIIDKVTKIKPFKINKKGMQTWIILK